MSTLLTKLNNKIESSIMFFNALSLNPSLKYELVESIRRNSIKNTLAFAEVYGALLHDKSRVIKSLKLIQETIGLLEERLEEHKKDLRTYHDSNVVASIARAKHVVEEIDPSSELLVSRIEESMRQFDVHFLLSEYEFASELQLSKFRDEVCELLEKENYAKRNFNADNDAKITALETRLEAISLANIKFVNKNAEI